jgi:hypothetical protein
LDCLLFNAGLKRCRDAIAREGSTRSRVEDGDAGGAGTPPSLAQQYLEASPEAAEIFTIWSSTGKVRDFRLYIVTFSLCGRFGLLTNVLQAG